MPDRGVSVIIPAYNAGRFLAEAVESAKTQAETREIIVVDDGSTDGTAALARRLGATLIEQPNKGPAAARNAGLSAASCEFLCFLDADDVLTNGALRVLFVPFEQDENLAAVFGKRADFNDGEPDVRSDGRFGALGGCALIRRGVFINEAESNSAASVGLFDETYRTAETGQWLARFNDAGLPCVRVDAVTCLRRLHGDNLGKRMRDQELRDYMRLIRERRGKKL